MQKWIDEWSLDDAVAMAKVNLALVSLSIYFSSISETYENDVSIDAYRTLRMVITSLSKATPDEPRSQAVCKYYYELQFGICTTLNIEEFEPIERNLTREEHNRRLALLDKGRLLFKQTMITAFAELPFFCDRNMLIRWGRIVYDHIHCFQAPPRLSQHQAAEDAAGLSDHFAELMQEVIQASPEATPGL